MKRLLVLFLALSLPLLAAAADTVVVTQPWTKLQVQPGEQAKAVRLLYGNDRLELRAAQGDWVQVRTKGGQQGWVRAADVRILQPDGTLAAGPARPAMPKAAAEPKAGAMPMDKGMAKADAMPKAAGAEGMTQADAMPKAEGMAQDAAPSEAQAQPAAAETMAAAPSGAPPSAVATVLNPGEPPDYPEREEAVETLMKDRGTPVYYTAVQALSRMYGVPELPAQSSDGATAEEMAAAEERAGEVLVWEGKQRLKEGRVSEAVVVFEEAYRLDPDNGLAFLGLHESLKRQIEGLRGAATRQEELAAAELKFQRYFPDAPLPGAQ